MQENTSTGSEMRRAGSAVRSASPINLTKAAAIQILRMIKDFESKKKIKLAGIRLKVLNKGCGGNQYSVEYAYDKDKYDEVFDIKSQFGTIRFIVSRLHLLKVIGTNIDYIQSKIEKGLVIKNARAKGKCGCEKSFYL